MKSSKPLKKVLKFSTSISVHVKDWSKSGIGFFCSRSIVTCVSTQPHCCENGWKIILAGSRFLNLAETRYAPIEGEAVAIVWSLEQTKYFTCGCNNLMVITDHKPLVKLFGDKMLDEISNPRLFSLRQRTLQWKFDIEYMPGKGNYFADATSSRFIGRRNLECDRYRNVGITQTFGGVR